MNKKEVAEIKRRLKKERQALNISCVPIVNPYPEMRL